MGLAYLFLQEAHGSQPQTEWEAQMTKRMHSPPWSHRLAPTAMALMFTLVTAGDAEARQGGREPREQNRNRLNAAAKAQALTALPINELALLIEANTAASTTNGQNLAESMALQLEAEDPVQAQLHALASILGALLASSASCGANVGVAEVSNSSRNP